MARSVLTAIWLTLALCCGASGAFAQAAPGPGPLPPPSFVAPTFTPTVKIGTSNNYLLDLDSLCCARIYSNVGGNVLTIRNTSSAQFSESSIRFTDSTANNSGNGAEHMAMGYDNGGSNDPFSSKDFYECSNDPQAGVGSTNPPTSCVWIQTGYIAAAGDSGRVSRVRQQISSDGTVNWYSADNLTAGVGKTMMTVPILYNSGIGINPLLTITKNSVGSLLDGLELVNSTAAANNTQEWSPAFHLQGQGWGTTAPGSQSVDWYLQVRPFQGTTAPTSNLNLTYSINGGTAIQPTSWDTNGGLNEYGNLIANVGNVGANIGFNGSTLLNAPSNGVLAIKNNSGSNSVNLTVGASNLLTMNGGLTVQGSAVTFSNAGYQSCTALTTNASGLVGCTISDRRVKIDDGVVANRAALAKVVAMPALHEFRYRPGYGPGGEHYGWWAQDVRAALPELVKVGPKTELTPDGEQQFDKDETVPLLLAAIKAQQAEIEALKNRVARLARH